MTGLVEKLAFGAIAAGLHALAFAAISQTGAQSQGAGGAGRVTLQGSTPQIEAMVAAWTAPPETIRPVVLTQPEPPVAEAPVADLPQSDRTPTERAAATPLPDLPEPPLAPQAAQLPPPRPAPAPVVAAAPSLPDPQPLDLPSARPAAPDPPRAAAPSAVARPSVPLAPPPPEAPKLADAAKTAPPPVTPKARPAKRAQRAAPAVQAQRAAGTGGGQQAGTSGRAQQSALGAGQRRDLIATWGARIIDRIERTKRAPRGVSPGGRVILRLQVSPDGTLRSVSVLKSSGNAALDAAAVNAVRRAGRFPPAPDGLADPVYSFSLPVRFNR